MQNLRAIRKSKGVTATAIARCLGVSRHTYAKYEENQETMSVAMAKRVCKFLGVHVTDVFLP